jgi:lysozyme
MSQYLAIARDQLPEDEGTRLKPYKDSVGVLTIGIGHNLEEGIPPEVVALLFECDLSDAVATAMRYCPIFNELDEVRKAVLVNMAFNLGLTRLRLFKGMLAAIMKKDFRLAAWHMENSLWAKQVQKSRSERLIRMMRTGKL